MIRTNYFYFELRKLGIIFGVAEHPDNYGNSRIMMFIWINHIENTQVSKHIILILTMCNLMAILRINPIQIPKEITIIKIINKILKNNEYQ